MSGRVRVGSGHPHTPLTPVYDAWSDAIDGLPGPTNSARLPPFFQLDVRAERTFVGRRSTTTAYLDVVNVLGIRNPLLATYDATYTRVVPVVWIPIVPVVGVRVAY